MSGHLFNSYNKNWYNASDFTENDNQAVVRLKYSLEQLLCHRQMHDILEIPLKSHENKEQGMNSR